MGKQSAAADTSHSINQRIKGGHKWAQQNEFQEAQGNIGQIEYFRGITHADGHFF